MSDSTIGLHHVLVVMYAVALQFYIPKVELTRTYYSPYVYCVYWDYNMLAQHQTY